MKKFKNNMDVIEKMIDQNLKDAIVYIIRIGMISYISLNDEYVIYFDRNNCLSAPCRCKKDKTIIYNKVWILNEPCENCILINLPISKKLHILQSLIGIINNYENNNKEE